MHTLAADGDADLFEGGELPPPSIAGNSNQQDVGAPAEHFQPRVLSPRDVLVRCFREIIKYAIEAV